MPRAHLEERRARVLESLNREAKLADGEQISREQREYLAREGQELYWNELAWEEITEEERVSGGHLTELAFPGFLAFVDGLLLDSAPTGVEITPRQHPAVVEDLLVFLASQYAENTAQLENGADSEELVWSRMMTGRLIDLVLYRLYRLSPEERDALEKSA